MEGEVIALGPGARDETGKLVPLDVKAGNRILFGKWSGTEVKLASPTRTESLLWLYRNNSNDCWGER